MKTMDLILAIVGVLTVAFMIAMIVTFWRFAMVPDTLIQCYFGMVAGECGIMGWIKTAKVRHEDRKWYKEDTDKEAQE